MMFEKNSTFQIIKIASHPDRSNNHDVNKSQQINYIIEHMHDPCCNTILHEPEPEPIQFPFHKKRDRRRKVRKKELNGTLIVGVVTHFLHSIDRKIREKRAQSK